MTHDLIGSISFGLCHRGLDYWITVIEWDEMGEGHYQATAGYVEVDTGELRLARPLDQVLDFVARVVADDDKRIFTILASEYQAEFSERIADELSRRRQGDADGFLFYDEYEGELCAI
jgi:hypothetical protein